MIAIDAIQCPVSFVFCFLVVYLSRGLALH